LLQLRDLKRRSAAAAAAAAASKPAFIGGTSAAAAAVLAAQEAAAPHELAVLDAFVEDFKIAKRAQTLRSKQVRAMPDKSALIL
jgi:hypothetical protein